MEKDACVFAVIPGDFNAVLLYKNKEEEKSWGIKPAGWGRPGGLKRLDEDEVEAVAREVREETGFYVEIDESSRHEELKENHLDVTYLCKVTGGKQKSRCQWFPVDALPRSTYSFHRKIILLMTGRKN